MLHVIGQCRKSQNKYIRSILWQCATRKQCLMSVRIVTSVGAMLYYAKIELDLGDASNVRYSAMNRWRCNFNGKLIKTIKY